MTIVAFKKGSRLHLDGEPVTVIEALDLATVLVRTSHGHQVRVAMADLTEAEKANEKKPSRYDAVRSAKQAAWTAALKPLIDMLGRTRADVKAAGATLGVGVDAVYDALARYEETKKLDDLPPPTRHGGRGASRLGKAVDKIVDDAIASVANRRHHSKRFFYRKARAAVTKAGVSISKSTLAARLAQIPPEKWLASREGHSEAKRRLAPQRGKQPSVQRAVQLVQIDHWRCDAEIYDNARTTIIGRPWLTLIKCVKTKVTVGFNLGLDDPGSTPTGLAIISMLTRKDDLLRRHGLLDTVKWPFWGKPSEIATDNGKDFTGRMMTTSAANYDITLSHRPVGEPQVGGDIESLNRSFSQWFADIPGATGSTPAARKKLRPEVTAQFILEELEKHVILLLDEYHNAKHSALGKPPMQAYTDCFFGPEGQIYPLPEARVDNLDLRADWYPVAHRSLQKYGIQIDFLQYYGEELSSMVTNRRKGEKLEVRRNPFDVTEIYVRNPSAEPVKEGATHRYTASGRWIIVPCTTLGYPRISIFEHEQLVRQTKLLDVEPTPMALAEHFDRQQRNIDEATKKTRKAQRNQTRRETHADIRKNSPVSSRSPVVLQAARTEAAQAPRGTVPPLDTTWLIPSELTQEFLMSQIDDC